MPEKAKISEIYNENTQTLFQTKRKQFQDLETGEIIEADAITKRVMGKQNFWKIFLMDFLAVLGVFDSKQVDVFVYIVQNTNPGNNLFIGTYKNIAKNADVSEPTIARIFKKLQEFKFIKKVQNGVWAVNPQILMKGDERKKRLLLSYYEENTQRNKPLPRRYTKEDEIPLSFDK